MNICPACGLEKHNVEDGCCEKCLTFPTKEEKSFVNETSKVFNHCVNDIKLDVHQSFIFINNIKFKKCDIEKCTHNTETESIIIYLKNGVKHLFHKKIGDGFEICSTINKSI